MKNKLIVDISAKNTTENTAQVTIEISNTSVQACAIKGIGFTIPRELSFSSDLLLAEREGDFYYFGLRLSLVAGGSISVELSSTNAGIAKITDMPTGLYLSTDGGLVDNFEDVSYVIDAQSLNDTKWSTLLIPTPQSIEITSDRRFNIPETLNVKALQNLSVAKMLFEQFKTLDNGSRFEHLPQFMFNEDIPEDVLFELDKNLPKSSYKIQVSPSKILITYYDQPSFKSAVISLVQLLCLAQSQSSFTSVSIESCQIIDQAKFSHRSIQIDTVRNFIPLDTLNNLLPVLALYKINKLVLTLTGDEGWRIESKLYPSLTSIGAYRGADLALKPHCGSGPKKTGGFYQQNDLIDLVQQAEKLGIEIVPEFDFPAHALAAIRSLPKLLPEMGNVENYSTVQGYTDNALAICYSPAKQFVSDILEELSALFPNGSISIGGKEVPENAWSESASYQEGLKNGMFDNQAEAVSAFACDNANQLLDKNIKVFAAQEMFDGKRMPLQATAVYWMHWTDVTSYLAQGNNVVLMSANRSNFDMAHTNKPQEPGFYWAGNISNQEIYEQIIDQYPLGMKEGVGEIIGLQAVLYSETVTSEKDIYHKLFPRIWAFSTVAWGTNLLHDYSSFKHQETTHQKLFETLNIPFFNHWN